MQAMLSNAPTDGQIHARHLKDLVEENFLCQACAEVFSTCSYEILRCSHQRCVSGNRSSAQKWYWRD